MRKKYPNGYFYYKIVKEVVNIMKKYRCPKCGETFTEKLEKCPRCGATFTYPVEVEPEPEVIEAVEVEVVDEPTIEVVGLQPDPKEEQNKHKTILAFVFSLISMFTMLFPFGIVSLALLGSTQIPRRHPHRTFYRIAKPVAIVSVILGPIVIAIIVLVVVLTWNYAKAHADAADKWFEEMSNFIRLFNI